VAVLNYQRGSHKGTTVSYHFPSSTRTSSLHFTSRCISLSWSIICSAFRQEPCRTLFEVMISPLIRSALKTFLISAFLCATGWPVYSRSSPKWIELSKLETKPCLKSGSAILGGHDLPQMDIACSPPRRHPELAPLRHVPGDVRRDH